MAATFGLFTDAALTTVATGPLVATQNVDGSTSPIQFHLYLGSLGSAGGNTVDRVAKADSNPGTDQITVSVTDNNSGTHTASEVKLATTQGGLSSATGGASLNLGTSILSGTANAVSIWVQVNDATHVVSTVTELGISLNTIRETVYP